MYECSINSIVHIVVYATLNSIRETAYYLSSPQREFRVYIEKLTSGKSRNSESQSPGVFQNG